MTSCCNSNIYNEPCDSAGSSITLSQIGDSEPASERILVDLGSGNYGIRGIIAGDFTYTDVDANGNIEIGVDNSGIVSGANIGSGEEVYVDGSAPDFQFKTISSGNPTTFVTSNATDIQISSTAVNSVGSGATLVATPFNQIKSIIGGSNVTVTNNANDLTLSSTNFSAQSVGAVGGADVYVTGTTPNFQFRKLLEGSNITLTADASGITIDAATGIVSLSTSGAGIDLVFNPSGVIKSLLSASPILAISDNGPDISFIITEPTPAAGSGLSLVASSSGNLFHRLIAGTNVALNLVGGEIEISSPNTVTDANNLTGSNIYVNKTGSTLNFRGIQVGTGLGIATTATFLNITRADTNSGAGAQVAKGGLTQGTFRSLTAGANITITQNADDITIAASGGGSLTLDNTSASIADGVQVTSSAMPISSGTAFFRRMLGGKNIITTQLVNSIRFDVDPAQRTNSFSVFRTSSVAIGAAYANIVFNSSAFPGYREVTSTYSTGTGVYTVPITGGYQFSYNLIIDTSLAASGLVEARLSITGSPFEIMYTNITIAGANLYSLNASGYYYCNNGNAVSVQIRYTGPGSVFVESGSGFTCWRQY